jgi:hypothetical protein
MSRLRTPLRAPQVTIRQPLECLLHAGAWGETSGGRWPIKREDMLKIYMLMVLIGAIAAMSHFKSERGSPERGL